ncbi:MAG: cysteine peptidase family C39 domain-containing protein, partial [Phycisphaerales bacterium]|nr:cysteine peptidase family C39 domain-containing protein [Phycisphaerales bacterium]
MVAKYYGKEVSILKLREASNINKEGVSLLGISNAAEKFGFKTVGAKIIEAGLDELNLLMCHGSLSNAEILKAI